ncbi:MAG: ketopantoate reductase family protein [Solirubrobacteraceae bacterium]
MTSVAVLGAGGVGGFVAAALTRAGTATTIVARPQTAEVLHEHGVRIRSAVLGDFEANPAVSTRLDRPVDVLLVATKAMGLQTALERVHLPPRLIVPLLNGLDHLELLRARFGAEPVAAAVIRVESDRPQTGMIVQTSPGCRIDVAADGAGVTALALVLRAAGLEVRTGTPEAVVMWSKLARLCPLALTTSAFDATLGELRADPAGREALRGAVSETVAVAVTHGAPLVAADSLAELEQAHPGLGSSMRRDIAAGREPELDAIAGAVLRAGARHGIECPTVESLAERVAARAGLAYSGGRIGSAGPSA